MLTSVVSHKSLPETQIIFFIEEVFQTFIKATSILVKILT